jgi:DNA-damage-inducible protein D
MGSGLKGLYGGLNQEQVARRKGVPKGKHLDFAGHEELATNYFKATQTEAKLKREGITKPTAANKAHKDVGEAIRKTIKEIGGTMPEDLPAEEDHVDDVRKRVSSKDESKKLEKKG